MNLFKKALVASAVVASFGAAAEATVSSSAIQMSAEGVAAGVTSADTNLVFDVVVGTLHPAASTITLTFDSTVDLDGLVGGAVVNTPSNGTGVAGANTIAVSAVGFDYGTGSFTFDNVVIDDNDQTKGEQDSISFDINLGNPLTANSAFRIYLGDVTALAGGVAAVDTVDIAGASMVHYSSETSGGDAIETGMGTISSEVTQFSASVKSAWNGIIERVAQVTFADDHDAGNSAADTVVFTLSNNEGLAAAVTGVTAAIDIEGNFDNATSSLADADFTSVALAGAPDLDETDYDDVALAVTNGELGVAGAASDIDLTFEADGTTDIIPQTGDLEATVTFTAAAPVVAAGDTWEYDLMPGAWELDATVINVPYFPVGFEGTSTSVHFANESSSVVDVIVSAIDADGNTYGPLDLGSDFDGDTVTKVSQGAIMSLFGLTESAKLSVTFNIDADDGDVNAYAFTTDDTGRTEISNSQLKGK
jgi:hypothetical protein